MNCLVCDKALISIKSSKTFCDDCTTGIFYVLHHLEKSVIMNIYKTYAKQNMHYLRLNAEYRVLKFSENRLSKNYFYFILFWPYSLLYDNRVNYNYTL